MKKIRSISNDGRPTIDIPRQSADVRNISDRVDMLLDVLSSGNLLFQTPQKERTSRMSTQGPEPTLIFIPDISGFTEFVHTTEVSHSQHIVRELLEKIIDSNKIGLEISEIEGDAVLFYRMGDAPTAQELLDQVREMYVKFHGHLKLYEQQRICQCGACISAHELQLKFVAHYGELTKSQVKDFDKLFGADLIVAHRLLKNKIPMDEYLLVTRSLEEKAADCQG